MRKMIWTLKNTSAKHSETHTSIIGNRTIWRSLENCTSGSTPFSCSNQYDVASGGVKATSELHDVVRQTGREPTSCTLTRRRAASFVGREGWWCRVLEVAVSREEHGLLVGERNGARATRRWMDRVGVKTGVSRGGGPEL